MNDPVHSYLFALMDGVEKRMPKPSMVVVCPSCGGDGLHVDVAASDWAFEQTSKCHTCGGCGRIATNGGEV